MLGEGEMQTTFTVATCKRPPAPKAPVVVITQYMKHYPTFTKHVAFLKDCYLKRRKQLEPLQTFFKNIADLELQNGAIQISLVRTLQLLKDFEVETSW